MKASSVESVSRQEKMLELRDALASIEEERASGHSGSTLEEVDAILNAIIDNEGASPLGADNIQYRRATNGRPYIHD